MLPYTSTGRATGESIAWLVAAAIVGAIIAGSLANVVGQFYRNALFSPIGMGAVVGLVGWLTIRVRRLRVPFIAATLGFLGGLGAFCFDHYLDYQRDRQALVQEMVRVVERLGGDVDEVRSHDNLQPAIDLALVRYGRGEGLNIINTLGLLGEASLPDHADVGAINALRGWTNARKKEGVSIMRGPNVNHTGMLGGMIFWTVTSLLCAVIASSIFLHAAREPACATCGNWYRPSTGAIPVANYGFVKHVQEALEQLDIKELVRMFPGRGLHNKYLAIDFRRCGHCTDAPVYTELQKVRRKNKSSSRITRGLMPADTAKDMTLALQAAHKHQREEAIRNIVRPKNQHRR